MVIKGEMGDKGRRIANAEGLPMKKLFSKFIRKKENVEDSKMTNISDI